MDESMVRTQIYLPQSLHRRLRERGEEEGTSMAAMIREAIAEYLLKTEPGSGPSGLAVREAQARYYVEDDLADEDYLNDPIWRLPDLGAELGGFDLPDGSVNVDKYVYDEEANLAHATRRR